MTTSGIQCIIIMCLSALPLGLNSHHRISVADVYMYQIHVQLISLAPCRTHRQKRLRGHCPSLAAVKLSTTRIHREADDVQQSGPAGEWTPRWPVQAKTVLGARWRQGRPQLTALWSERLARWPTSDVPDVGAERTGREASAGHSTHWLMASEWLLLSVPAPDSNTTAACSTAALQQHSGGSNRIPLVPGCGEREWQCTTWPGHRQAGVLGRATTRRAASTAMWLHADLLSHGRQATAEGSVSPCASRRHNTSTTTSWPEHPASLLPSYLPSFGPVFVRLSNNLRYNHTSVSLKPSAIRWHTHTQKSMSCFKTVRWLQLNRAAFASHWQRLLFRLQGMPHHLWC